jgi:hypothetical protein
MAVMLPHLLSLRPATTSKKEIADERDANQQT